MPAGLFGPVNVNAEVEDFKREVFRLHKAICSDLPYYQHRFSTLNSAGHAPNDDHRLASH